MDKVAWIGLGTMGAPMARNLSEKGYSVVAYNRSKRELDIGSTRVVHTVEEAVSDSGIVIVMVSDGAAVRNVLFGDEGAVRYMREGTLVVNMSTIGVEETKQFALELANHGLEWMDAPVSGSKQPAIDGTLVILAGGSSKAFEVMKPLFLAMGKSAHHLGPIGSGAAIKLLVNTMLGTTVAAVSECMSVADKAGFGAKRLLDVLSETGVWAPVIAGKRTLWEEHSYNPAFALKHMTKDLGLMAGYGVQLSAGLPVAQAVLSTYLQAQANDLGEYDMASVYEYVRKSVGVE